MVEPLSVRWTQLPLGCPFVGVTASVKFNSPFNVMDLALIKWTLPSSPQCMPDRSASLVSCCTGAPTTHLPAALSAMRRLTGLLTLGLNASQPFRLTGMSTGPLPHLNALFLE